MFCRGLSANFSCLTTFSLGVLLPFYHLPIGLLLFSLNDFCHSFMLIPFYFLVFGSLFSSSIVYLILILPFLVLSFRVLFDIFHVFVSSCSILYTSRYFVQLIHLLSYLKNSIVPTLSAKHLSQTINVGKKYEINSDTGNGTRASWVTH